jgi:hypothetical protein
MKGPVRDNATFTFNATAKTITFSAPIPSSQQQILAVLNVTRNAWLYLPVNAAYGGTWTSPVLTVTTSTTGHANGDVLQIFVDDGLASTSNLQTTANASLSAIDADLGTDGTSAPTLPGGSTGVRGWLRYLSSLLPTLAGGAWPVADNAGSLTVDGTAYAATVSFTRPANVTAYTAGDVIGTGASNDAIYTLTSIGSSGGYVVVQSIELVLGISAVPSGMTGFRVHFYDSSPNAAADNSVFDVASGDRAKYLGYIDLPAPVDLGSTCFTQIDYPGKLFKLAASSTSLFCELQTIGGFTPAANSEAYILRVKTLEAGK